MWKDFEGWKWEREKDANYYNHKEKDTKNFKFLTCVFKDE